MDQCVCRTAEAWEIRTQQIQHQACEGKRGSDGFWRKVVLCHEGGVLWVIHRNQSTHPLNSLNELRQARMESTEVWRRCGLLDNCSRFADSLQGDVMPSGGAECRRCPLACRCHGTPTDTIHPKLVRNSSVEPSCTGFHPGVLGFPSMVNSVVLCIFSFTIPSGSLLAMVVQQVRRT